MTDYNCLSSAGQEVQKPVVVVGSKAKVQKLMMSLFGVMLLKAELCSMKSIIIYMSY